MDQKKLESHEAMVHVSDNLSVYTMEQLLGLRGMIESDLMRRHDVLRVALGKRAKKQDKASAT